jgi:D-alanyl-D-alanine dipeptidase
MTDEHVVYPEIPLDAGQVQGWKEIPIRSGNDSDPLVPLGLLSPEAAVLTTSSIYFGEHNNSPYAEAANKLDGSLLTLFARQSVARRLLAVEQFLPAGHHLLVLDAYRPHKVQASLYESYKQKLAKKYPDMNEDTLNTITQKYVSLPSKDIARPSPHNTGGAVDVAVIRLDQIHEKTLYEIRSRLTENALLPVDRIGLELRLSEVIRHHGELLDFGTAFDHGGSKSALAYYEFRAAGGEILSDDDVRACNNRRLLFAAMTKAGFQPYFAEWWHFNAPESQMGAATAGRDYATFGAVSLEEDHLAHESERHRVREEALQLAALRRMGDPRVVGDWPMEIIAPPEE